MTAYYNEFDPYAAQWLRNLISAGLIAPGEVDERSITDVRFSELAVFTQCHFFAGIGGWSLALRLAGWPDDEPVWTGSCPCQPFSVAGKGKGADDERHLWPVWFELIRECRPSTVFGEQVAAAVGHNWLDAVSRDLEGEGYAVGAAVLGAHSVGAPHIRQRLWFGAQRLDDTAGARRDEAGRGEPAEPEWRRGVSGLGCNDGLLADAGSERRDGQQVRLRGRGQDKAGVEVAGDGADGGVENADMRIAQQPSGQRARPRDATSAGAHHQPDGRGELAARQPVSGPLHGFWRDADWLFCRDGKWRPVEPGSFPLAHGLPGRVGRLRAYGNAIVPQVAAKFIAAFEECRP